MIMIIIIKKTNGQKKISIPVCVHTYMNSVLWQEVGWGLFFLQESQISKLRSESQNSELREALYWGRESETGRERGREKEREWRGEEGETELRGAAPVCLQVCAEKQWHQRVCWNFITHIHQEFTSKLGSLFVQALRCFQGKCDKQSQCFLYVRTAGQIFHTLHFIASCHLRLDPWWSDTASVCNSTSSHIPFMKL